MERYWKSCHSKNYRCFFIHFYIVLIGSQTWETEAWVFASEFRIYMISNAKTFWICFSSRRNGINVCALPGIERCLFASAWRSFSLKGIEIVLWLLIYLDIPFLLWTIIFSKGRVWFEALRVCVKNSSDLNKQWAKFFCLQSLPMTFLFRFNSFSRTCISNSVWAISLNNVLLRRTVIGYSL